MSYEAELDIVLKKTNVKRFDLVQELRDYLLLPPTNLKHFRFHACA